MLNLFLVNPAIPYSPALSRQQKRIFVAASDPVVYAMETTVTAPPIWENSGNAVLSASPVVSIDANAVFFTRVSFNRF